MYCNKLSVINIMLLYYCFINHFFLLKMPMSICRILIFFARFKIKSKTMMDIAM